MLKKTVTYKNLFTGEEETVDLYFHLSRADLIEMQMSVKGGLEDKLRELVATDDETIIYPEFKKIVLLAHGERSEDGKTFVKSDEISKAFTQTEAYSEFLIWLMSSTEALIEFIGGIMPGELTEEVRAEVERIVADDDDESPNEDATDDFTDVDDVVDEPKEEQSSN